MLMPCHSVTLCYLAAMYARKHSTGEFIFNIAIHYMFFTWLALLLPDRRGLTQFFEIENFWVHHWMLFIVPIYLIFSLHYKVDHVDHYHYKLASGFGALLHFNVMSLAGLISGHNVSYMVYPPSKSPAQGTYYRLIHMVFLVVMGWVGGYLVPAIVIKLSTSLGFPYYQTQKDVEKTKTQ